MLYYGFCMITPTAPYASYYAPSQSQRKETFGYVSKKHVFIILNFFERHRIESLLALLYEYFQKVKRCAKCAIGIDI
jgi:hypothetical protein